ncbi:hypothetical protein [Streptomyces sp. RB17]|uniref:hypothetical protein n=1 Tax=Streptomyces sp. RB17 TaxID=2585197 RepID=UPI001294ABC6|nr:hypothetical protein [Streptomyces sp. RB17]
MAKEGDDGALEAESDVGVHRRGIADVGVTQQLHRLDPTEAVPVLVDESYEPVTRSCELVQVSRNRYDD